MKKSYIILLLVAAVFLAFYFNLIPLEIAHTGMLVCPGKPVTISEWTFPSLWTTKPPECVTNPNGNAIIYPLVEIKTPDGTVIHTWAGGTTIVPCAYGIKLADITFTVPNTQTGQFYVYGTYSNQYGTVFHTYTDMFSSSSSSCTECTPEQHKCNGNYLLTCTANGVYNIGGKLCEFGCVDPGSGTAYCNTKQPNYIHCTSNTSWEKYSADGTYVAERGGCDMLYTCVEGQGCVPGGSSCYGDADCKACFSHCIDHQCQVTGSQPAKPCANAYWQGYPACGWNTNDCTPPYVESCGNGFCGVGENYTTCPVDCKNEVPQQMADWQYILIILGFILVVGGLIWGSKKR